MGGHGVSTRSFASSDVVNTGAAPEGKPPDDKPGTNLREDRAPMISVDDRGRSQPPSAHWGFLGDFLGGFLGVTGRETGRGD